jgi:MFS family permease
LVSPANLGLAYGITETVSGLAMAAAPPLAGYLYSRRPEDVFIASLLLILPVLTLTILRRKMLWKL